MLPALLFLATAAAHNLAAREKIDQPAPIIDTSEPIGNTTYIAFPQAHDWFTLGTTNYVLWDWAELHNPSIRIVLDRPDGDVSMLRGPLVVNDKVPANMFGIKYNGTLQAAPGHGYRIRLHDFANDSIIYAKSELFEIKAVGADPTIPVPWGSSQPSAVSAATRAVAGTGAVAGVLLAMLL